MTDARPVEFTPDEIISLKEIVYALNSYNNSVKAAEGVISGARVFSRKESERLLLKQLWDNREQIAKLVREKPWK